MKIALYLDEFWVCGGIESFIYYFCKRYKDLYDIIVYYDNNKPTDPQIIKLSSIVKCKKNDGNIKADLLIVNRETSKKTHNPGDIKKTVYVMHGNPGIGLPDIFKKYDKYILVSKNLSNMCGYNKKSVFYIPIDLDPVRNNKSEYIKLVTASRLSPDKGGSKIFKLAHALNKNKVNFKWDIYSDMYTPSGKLRKSVEKLINIKNVNILPTCHEGLNQKIADSTFLVQLSDAETFGLSIYEALLSGTKIITTNLPTVKEMNPPNGCSVILNNDSDFEIQRVVDIIKNTDPKYKFNYEPLYTQWDRFLYEFNNYINGIQNKTKVFIVKGRLEYDINEKDYIILTDTKQENRFNYRICDINNLNYSIIKNFIKL